MRGRINSTVAKKEHNQLKSCWSEETLLSQKILISILYHLEQQQILLAKIKQGLTRKPPKRKISKYAKFFAQKAREGLSAKEIGRLWKTKT